MGSLRLFVSLLAALALLSPALCANGTQGNASNATPSSESLDLNNLSLPTLKLPNASDIKLPKVNFSDWGDKLKNATSGDGGPVDSVVGFLTDASPFLLLVAGIILLILSGFGKLVGMLLIGLAVVRLLILMFSG